MAAALFPACDRAEGVDGKAVAEEVVNDAVARAFANHFAGRGKESTSA